MHMPHDMQRCGLGKRLGLRQALAARGAMRFERRVPGKLHPVGGDHRRLRLAGNGFAVEVADQRLTHREALRNRQTHAVIDPRNGLGYFLARG